ncbi:transposable element Tcb2 transposase [Trichonephila clavipes]|nr:transposable element Tcb2 transposase [Trichonephila clavipes]
MMKYAALWRIVKPEYDINAEILFGSKKCSKSGTYSWTLRRRQASIGKYMKYLYPYECVKEKLSTNEELQAAIDGNRREGRRSSYGPYSELVPAPRNSHQPPLSSHPSSLSMIPRHMNGHGSNPGLSSGRGSASPLPLTYYSSHNSTHLPLNLAPSQENGIYSNHALSSVPQTTFRTTSKDRAPSLVDPTVTRSTIREDVGIEIVPQTISRHRAEVNLKSKCPFRALPLTPEHRQLRLQWYHARSMWNVTDWQKVVFSDESRFVLGTDDNRVRVWWCPGERYYSPHTVLRHTASTAGVMVWGAIAYDSRSTLIVMRGTSTGQRYVNDILRPHTLLWPARSPDLSPVEHVWDQLKRQMPSCHSVHDLEMVVQDLWAPSA